MKLKITVSRTRGGDQDYLQIISDDQFSVNVVLIAERIEINDARPKRPERPKP
jgi:hypothetical protein